jgi:anti-sigma-K factor RskA
VTHEQLRNNLEAWALGALRPSEAAELERHLSGCPNCREAAAAFAAVPLAIAASAPLAVPSAGVRAQLLSSIQAGSAKVRVDDAGQVVSSGRVRLPWLALAATLLLTAYLGWDVLRLRQQVAALNQQLADARATAAASEGRLAALQRASSQQAAAYAVLAAPDVAPVALAGQDPTPQARGRAFWSRERGMVVSIAALPPAPAGRTYQVWVVTTAPAPISAGLIEPGADGTARAVFATPADIPQPVAIAVTLEPAGGVPSPTGPKVLVGTVSG